MPDLSLDWHALHTAYFRERLTCPRQSWCWLGAGDMWDVVATGNLLEKKSVVLLKTLFLYIGCHNPVTQQSSGSDLSSLGIPHVTSVHVNT